MLCRILVPIRKILFKQDIILRDAKVYHIVSLDENILMNVLYFRDAIGKLGYR